MTEFNFSFQIANFSESGEEFRLRHYTQTWDKMDGLESAVRRLVDFVAKILKCKPDHLAAKRIILKSAWKNSGKKVPIPAKDILTALIGIGLNTKGRAEERQEVIKKPIMTKTFRRK